MSEIKALTEKIKKFRDERDWMQFHSGRSAEVYGLIYTFNYFRR